jgi:hypothetical protein
MPFGVVVVAVAVGAGFKPARIFARIICPNHSPALLFPAFLSSSFIFYPHHTNKKYENIYMEIFNFCNLFLVLQ